MPGLEEKICERAQNIPDAEEGKKNLTEMQRSMKQAYLRSKIAAEGDLIKKDEEGFFNFETLEKFVAKNYEKI